MARARILLPAIVVCVGAVTACTVKHVTIIPEDDCSACEEPTEDPTIPVDVVDASSNVFGDTKKDAAAKPATPEEPATDASTLPPCSNSADATGLIERSLLGGTFWTYVPASYDRSSPLPLVVALHGAGDSAKNYLTFEWQANADARGFVVLAPQGTAQAATGYDWAAEDRARILAAIDDVRACYAIAKKGPLIQGFSAGADMALFVGLTYSNDFAGIAVASGSLSAAETSFSSKTPLLPAAHKLPVSLWRGTTDPIVTLTDVTDSKDRLEAAGHTVTLHSFKGSHKTTPTDALAQYDELSTAL
jgi:poly(3-hydroxybutyrate) depolymerase